MYYFDKLYIISYITLGENSASYGGRNICLSGEKTKIENCTRREGEIRREGSEMRLLPPPFLCLSSGKLIGEKAGDSSRQI